jgi:hypothetical protein
MSDGTKQKNVIEALPGYGPEIGRWLWAVLAPFLVRAVSWHSPRHSASVGIRIAKVASIEAAEAVMRLSRPGGCRYRTG